MTDNEYFEAFSLLCEKLAKTKELDGELFWTIFEAKIRPIVKNAFSEVSSYFNAIDLEDMYHDLYIKLWRTSVAAYFMNEQYEIDAQMYRMVQDRN